MTIFWCVDDLNEFVKEEETQTTQSDDLRNNSSWLAAAKKVYEWEQEKQTLSKD